MNKKKRKAKRERTKKYKQRIHITPTDVKNAGLDARQVAEVMRILGSAFYCGLKKRKSEYPGKNIFS